MSSEAPPPTDRIASAPEARYASMPFSASLSVGFGSNSLKTANGIPACSSNGVTNRRSPAWRIPLSVTSSSLRAPTRFSSAGSSRTAPRPWTMRVGKDMTCGMGRSSDDLEVSLHLPLRHRGLELAAFPVAGAHVVIHESLPEELAHLLAARERLGGRAQRRRKRLRLGVVAVPHRLRRKRQLVLHAMEAGGDRSRDRDVGVHVGGGEPVLDARRGGRSGDDAQSGGAVLHSPGGERGGPGAAHHPLVRVHGRG